MHHKLHIALWSLLLTLLLAACGGDGAGGVGDVPLAPTGLTATPSEGVVTLRWQDRSDNETGFSIYRREASADTASVDSTELGGQQASAFRKLGSVGENVTEFEDTSVTPGTLYRYGVTADGEAGSSAVVATEEDAPVAAGNRAPTANGQSFSTPEDVPIAVTLTGSDPDGDTLSYTIVTAPAYGKLSGDAPKLLYTPKQDYSGKDSFTFTVSDGKTTSAAATVTFTVGAVNDAPTANDKEVSTEEDTPVTITLTGSDPEGAALGFAIVKKPGKGSLGELARSTGKVTYTPKADVNGQDSFTFTVSDGASTSAEATVTINLGVVNDAPVAKEQTVELDEDTTADITLEATDPDNDKLTFEVVRQPAHGSLSGDAPKLTYTPAKNYSGADSFKFKANDGNDDSAEVTVSLTVKPVNDAPDSVTLDNNTVAENQNAGTAVGSFSATDVDTEGGFTYSLVEGEADNASFEINGDQLETKAPFDYEAKREYSVRVEVNDGAGGTLQQSFTVTVADVDDTKPEVTFSDPGGLTVDQAVTLSGTVGDNVGVASVELFEGEISLGKATLEGDAWSYSYTPAKAGTFTLRAVATDAAGNSAEASKDVTVAVFEPIVTTTADSGSGSLRQVLQKAPAGSTVTFAASLSGQTITLTSGQLTLSKNVTIDGMTANGNVSVSGNNSSRVFFVNSEVEVTLKDLTVTGGSNDKGGGIYNGGTLILSGNSRISNNTASAASYSYGGGVYNAGTLTLQGSASIKGNSLPGAYSRGSGVFSVGTLTMQDNASILNNTSQFLGGGVAAESGTFVMQGNASISGNKTDTWGGSGVYVGGGGVTFIMKENASITGNTATAGRGGAGVYNNGTFTMHGNASISNNTAPRGGGVYLERNTLTMEGDASITNNVATTKGGGVFIDYYGVVNNVNAGGNVRGNTPDDVAK